MTRVFFTIVVSLVLQHRFVPSTAVQARFVLSASSTIFIARNFSTDFLRNSSLSSEFQCARECLIEYRCRVFVHDANSSSCQLYQSDATSGQIASSPSSSPSRVAAIQYEELVSYYNSTCEYCRLNRYLICQNDRCQCSTPEAFWNGSTCKRRSVLNESCTSMLDCRNDLNLTCVFGICARNTSIYTKNWVINGDAESGSCPFNDSIAPPTSWNYNGTITQMAYNSTLDGQKYSYAGPSNRGICYFIGERTPETTMWQFVDLTSAINSAAIDAGTVRFNLSAWLGGFTDTDDNGRVSLSLLNQTNGSVGNLTTIGPVLAAQRNNLTSLLFRQAGGFVPIGTRSARVTVILNRTFGTYNDGAVDNIELNFYQ